MNGKKTRSLFTRTTGFVGGVSAALLLSLPAVAQQGPLNPNSNTSPTPAPAAPNTYSPSTGDPTVRIAPGGNSSNQIDRTQNPNSVQQPNGNRSGGNYNSVTEPSSTSEPANRSRVQDRSTGTTPNSVNGVNRQDTNTMGEVQTESIRPLQEPAGRSRYDDRSTGFNQDNYDRLSGVDENNSNQYPNSMNNSVRTESNNSSYETRTNQGNVDSNQMDSGKTKQMQSTDSPNQKNPNAGSSDGSGTLGDTQSPTMRNSESSGNQRSDYQTPYGNQAPGTANQGNPGTRTGVEQRTQTVDQQRSTTTVDQQRGNRTINNTAQPSTQPSYGTQPSSGGQAGGQGSGGQAVQGLW